MILFKKKADLPKYLASRRQETAKIGFVPTMGALHPGHLSLIENCRKENSITICSIFINPAQFNDPADFEKYPVSMEKDILMLESAGCDVLFLPSVEEMYPGGPASPVKYELGYLETILEGKYRPGHFQGVCKVMHLLLDIVKADNLYLGQKDYQQCLVIRKLTELTGQNEFTNIRVCPILREPNGLAMSSRNMRLSMEEREKAAVIYQSLNDIRKNLRKGNLQELKGNAVEKLHDQGFKVDYIEIADALTLEIVNEWDGKQKLVALAAAFLNEIRLIDNLLMTE
jgi:pantoate--beta-alanine ligase